MKELEQIDCEIRKVIDLQISVSNRLTNVEDDEHGSFKSSSTHNNFDHYRGGFLNGTTYVWLTYDCHLVVVNVKTGESISSWNFCQKITSVSQFPTQSGELPLILLGLDNGASRIRDSTGLLCIFDCATSRVLRAIRMPVGVEQVCVISGGAEWEEFNEKRPDSALNQMTGIACVVLRNLHHIIVDLQRPLWDRCESSQVMDEISPADIEFYSAKAFHSNHQLISGKHTGYHLLNERIEKRIGFNREKFELSNLTNNKLTSALVSSTKIGCLISGCLDRVIIWQNDGSVGWISPPMNKNVIVTHLDLLEPTDDPRPFYYLWVVFQDEVYRTAPVLRMYALLFERKFCDKRTNLYFNMEGDPSLKFEFELDDGDRVISLSTIERDTSSEQTDTVNKRGEDSLLLISTIDRTYLFDLNQWYKEQMPYTVYKCQNPNSVLASYNMKSSERNATNNQVISCSYVASTLREFPNNYPNSTEELFYPNSLSLEWVELSLTKLTFWMTRGVQADLLREMAIAGPVILLQPAETFHRCLSVGLVPFNMECSFTSDRNVQREMLLSLCLEQRWATFLVKCAKEWSDGSASYLYPTFLKWGVQRASSIKVIADRLCIPLFDQSGSNIGETEVRTLRFCSQQLECLSNVVAKIPLDTGDFVKQRQALKRVSTYFQVLLWFYDVGLLPETQELEEGSFPISLALKVPYPVEKLQVLYKDKREQLKKSTQTLDQNEKGLFIDELMTRECCTIKAQWEKEGGDVNASSYYPPPSLQTLLRGYLIDCHENESNEIACKHQITIYLLMDLAVLLQPSYPSVDQLIKYPSAFKMSPSLIKLTQAFWLLDHEDYQGFLDMMTGQLVLDSDVKDWHHKLVLRTLVQNNQHKLALMYLRIRKPPLSSVEDQGTVIKLSVEHGLVQSAFHRRPPTHYAQLLVCFFRACKTYGKLSDILHLALDSEEEEVFVKYLKEDNFKDLQLLYYLQRCRYTEAINENSFAEFKVNLQKNVHPTSFSMLLHAYDATLPDVTKRFSVNMAKFNCDMDLESTYPKPMSHYRGKMQGVHGAVIKKAKETFVRTDKCQIPFISAPCTSLKVHDNSSMNCVLFPTLARGICNKRTLDQVFEDEDGIAERVDCSKRRKLSNGVEVINNSDKKEIDFDMVFDSPLVKRKTSVATGKVILPGTPHSILKIRQLIKDSASASMAPSCIPEQDIDGSQIQKENKLIRQIRFSIEQLNSRDVHEDVNANGPEIDNKADTTHESDVFFSPNTSTKTINESILLSDSSYSGKNIYQPRPRRSLRRSLHSSKESLYDSKELPKNTYETFSPHSSSRNAPLKSHSRSLCNAERGKQHTTPARMSSKRLSLLSTSIYSTSVLSSDTSFETSILRKESDRSLNQDISECCMEEDNNYNCANVQRAQRKIHSEEATENNNPYELLSTKIQNNDDTIHSMKMDEREVLTMLPDLFTEKEKNIEDNGPVLVETNSNEGVMESYSSRKQESRIHEVNQQIPATVTTSDESDEESINLQWKDDDDAEEIYASLSNSVEEEKQRTSPNMFTNESSWDNQRNYKNGFQNFAKIAVGAFDITDDESSNSEDRVTQLFPETKSSSVSRLVSVPVTSAHGMCDVTDDESNNSIDTKYFNTASVTSNYDDHKAALERASANVWQISNKSCENSLESSVGKPEPYKKASNLNTQVENIRTQKMFNEKTIVRTKGKNTSLKNSMGQNEETVTRMTRSRRLSSAISDSNLSEVSDFPMNKLPVENIRRSRRASSLAKEVLSSSIRTIDDRESGSSNTESPSRTPKKSQMTTSLSTMKVTTPVCGASKDAEPKTPIRRSARHASSVLKEEVEVVRKTTERRTRTASISSATDETKDEEIGKKKTMKSKKTCVFKATNKPIIPEDGVGNKIGRKRGSSVPKEMVVGTAGGRTRRSSSVMNEVLENAPSPKSVGSKEPAAGIGRTRRSSSVAKEDVEITASQVAETRKTRSSASRVKDTLRNSPAANTRLRRSSIQSVPEELEDIMKAPSRERRAVSVEPPQAELKRRTRNFRARSVLKDPIIEEPPLEPEENAESKDVAGVKKPTRRKRTASVSNARETDYNVSTEKCRRKRESGFTNEDKEQFAFSQPEKAEDEPVDRKDIGQVPKFVFSPPHTRSKHVPNQHRRNRKLDAFMTLPSQEEELSQIESKTSQNKPGNYTRVIFVKQDAHRKFRIPKLSKNI